MPEQKSYSHAELATIGAARIAGFFHDIGKASSQFQKFLRDHNSPDSIRHELLSFLAVRYFQKDDAGKKSDAVFLARLSQLSEADIESALLQACQELNGDRGQDFNEKKIAFFDKENAVISDMVLFCILSHHKMPEANDRRGMRPRLTPYIKDKDKTISRMPDINPVPLEEKQHWGGILDSVHKSAELLSTLDLSGFLTPYGLPGVLEYARVPMMLADHNVSFRSKMCEATPMETVGAFANTGREANKNVLKQQLGQHLLETGKKAGFIARRFMSLNRQLPHTSVVGSKISAPSTEGPYGWQGHCRHAVIDANIGSQGFIGFVVASTGSGKTLGNAVIMSALNNDEARYSIALGLRTLTVQTSRAIREQIPDICVHIGSEAAMKMAEDTSNDDTDIVQERPFHKTHSIIQSFVSPQYHSYMMAPVLISTIDSLVSVFSRTHIALRMLTSDLVLDELDNYDIMDQGIIMGLIKMAGAYGRKLLISSATLPKEIVDAAIAAYSEGYQEYALMRGEASVVRCGFFSDEAECIAISDSSCNDLSDFYDRQLTCYLRLLDNRNKVRRVEILSPSIEKELFFNDLLEGAYLLHCENHIVDEKTGKRLSVGYIRFPHIRDVIMASQELSALEKFMDFRIVCYHSRHVFVARNAIEKFIDGLTDRKDENALLENPAVRDLLETSERQDVSIIIVASPVAEVGRDTDFDWHIHSPSGTPNLVQAAGRVRRHRKNLPWDKVNILLLDRPFAVYRDLWTGKKMKEAYFCNPGVETKFTDFTRHIVGEYRLGSHKTEDVMDVLEMMSGITAAPCLRTGDSLMSRLEHQRNFDVMSKISLPAIREHRFSNFSQKVNFREGDEKKLVYIRGDGGFITGKMTAREQLRVQRVEGTIKSILNIDIEAEYVILKEMLFPEKEDEDARRILMGVDINTYGRHLCDMKMKYDTDCGLIVD